MIKFFQEELSISNLVSDNGDNYVNDHVRRELTNSLAEAIVDVDIQETKYEYHKTYSMNVIVATEQDFYKAVAEYAQNMRYGAPLSLQEMLDTK